MQAVTASLGLNFGLTFAKKALFTVVLWALLIGCQMAFWWRMAHDLSPFEILIVMAIPMLVLVVVYTAVDSILVKYFMLQCMLAGTMMVIPVVLAAVGNFKVAFILSAILLCIVILLSQRIWRIIAR